LVYGIRERPKSYLFGCPKGQIKPEEAKETYMKYQIFTGVVLLMLTVLIGCTQTTQNNPATPDIRDLDKVDVGGLGVSCVDIIAGQYYYAGEVCFLTVDADGDGEMDTLRVTYTTTDEWEMVNYHFWIGSSLSTLPVSKGKIPNPIPGQFPFKKDPINPPSHFETFDVPFSYFGFVCPGPAQFYAAAHCTVRKLNADGTYQTQTGWGNGYENSPGGNWGMVFFMTLTCEVEPFPCDTAFAYGGDYATCFQEFDFDGDGRPDFQRWGWTNGPLEAGEYEFQIYAGAGQCDLSKGTLVGSLTVNYDGSSATVTYTMKPGYYLEETHLYVGNDVLPKVQQGPKWVYTVAPGQYPYSHDLDGETTDTYTVAASGNIYVIAHAANCHDWS
jgi:hypothetical protein